MAEVSSSGSYPWPAWQTRPPRRSAPWTRTSIAWGLGGAALAAAVALTATVDLKTALAVTIAIALAAVVVIRPSLLPAALVASVFLEVVSVGGVSISRLLAPIALVVILAASTRPGSRIRAGSPFAMAVLYGIWALASALWTVRLSGTTYLLSSLAIAYVYMLAFALLVRTRRELERVFVAFAASALAIGAFALAAFFVGFSNDLLQGRASGGTGDPNFFAAYQLVALPLVFVLAAEVRRRWLRAALAVTMLVIIGSVLASVSRGGLLTLVVISVVMLALPAGAIFRDRKQKRLFLLVCVIGAGILASASAGSIVPRLEQTFAPSDTNANASGNGRLLIWAAAWRSTKERPFLGLGYGAFVNVSNELILGTPGISLRNFDLRPNGSEVHNAYLGALTELGIPGLFLFLALLTSTAVALRRAAVKARAASAHFLARAANALLVSLFGWSIASIFLSSETSRALWIVIGLSLALPRLVDAEAASPAADR